jgi:hypothetical protein
MPEDGQATSFTHRIDSHLYGRDQAEEDFRKAMEAAS